MPHYMTGDGAFETAVAGQAAFLEVFGKEYRRHYPVPKRYTAGRPLCACCGKPYGSRATRVHETTVTAPPTPYAGNELLVSEELFPWGLSTDTPKGRLVRTTWDGSYVLQYEPFCTLRCALAFARSAHRDGYGRK